MKRRLWVKLIGGFTLIIILGGIIMYVAVQRSTRSRYRELVRESDLAAAEYLAPFFADYYAAEGGWRGVESLFVGRGDRGGAASRGRMGRERMMTRRGFGLPRIVLTDTKGGIVADSAGEAPESQFEPPERHGWKQPSKPTHPEDLTGGMPIRISGEDAGRTVGYLYVGTMIGPVLEPADRAFLRSVNRSVFFTTVLVVILAAGVGTFLVINITFPIWSLYAAAKRIGRGDLSARAGKIGTSKGKKRRDELGELTEQFNSMADSLEKAAESRRRLIADTAHELRTPVSLIQGKLEMVLEGVYPPDRNTLSSIHEETKLLAGLIGELQQLADADAGVLLLVKKKTALNTVVEQSVSMFAPEMERKKIKLHMDLPQGNVDAYVDSGKITQVITNILSNSVRYTPEGGSIEVKLEERKGEVRLTVTNSGPPIPGDKLEAIFDRFFRIDEGRNRKEGGTGLGLAICKVIVEAHGGRIRAENIRGLQNAGVRFTFSLPATA
jgi:signal transduction histidine kinase